MKKSFTIKTIGCKVNTYESEKIRDELIKFGFNYIDVEEKETEIPYNTSLRVSGFSSYITIFLVALGAIDIILIILWIFKHVR